MTTVLYVDFGYQSAREFWNENAIPAFQTFQDQRNRANAINAAIYAWQIHDWIWHEQHPGEDTYKNTTYKKFKKKLIKKCPELSVIRDVADAAKHRGLGRSDVRVKRIASQTYFITNPAHGGRPATLTTWNKPLQITLADHKILDFANTLSKVMDFWRTRFFL
jgi:hypothetical protein